MIVTQDHVNHLIDLYSKADNMIVSKDGSDTQLLLSILSCIDVRRSGRWLNQSFILDTTKQSLVVEEET